jgi:hypothetical protein
MFLWKKFLPMKHRFKACRKVITPGSGPASCPKHGSGQQLQSDESEQSNGQ